MKYNKEMRACFIDLEKEFGSIPERVIWKSLVKRGVFSPLIERI